MMVETRAADRLEVSRTAFWTGDAGLIRSVAALMRAAEDGNTKQVWRFKRGAEQFTSSSSSSSASSSSSCEAQRGPQSFVVKPLAALGVMAGRLSLVDPGEAMDTVSMRFAHVDRMISSKEAHALCALAAVTASPGALVGDHVLAADDCGTGVFVKALKALERDPEPFRAAPHTLLGCLLLSFARQCFVDQPSWLTHQEDLQENSRPLQEAGYVFLDDIESRDSS